MTELLLLSNSTSPGLQRLGLIQAIAAAAAAGLAYRRVRPAGHPAAVRRAAPLTGTVLTKKAD